MWYSSRFGKFQQDPENTSDIQKSLQAPHESQGNGQNSTGSEDLIAESGSISNASNEKRKVSREDIELVRYLVTKFDLLPISSGSGKQVVSILIFSGSKSHRALSSAVYE